MRSAWGSLDRGLSILSLSCLYLVCLPQCSGAVEPDWLVCPACLSKLPAAANEVATETRFANSPVRSSTTADEGRFPAGTVLAGRYRVLGLLGSGCRLPNVWC